MSANTCSAGYYCLAGSTTGTGTVGSGGTATPCESGDYCPGSISSATGNSCPVGYVCTDDTTSEALCTAGYYCPAGTCTTGSNGECANGNTPMSVNTCSAGYYCPAQSGSETPCPVGYVCTDDATSKALCTAGYYCPAGTCTTGSNGECANDNTPMSANTCSAGYYCLAGSTTGTGTVGSGGAETPCPVGYYCPISTSSADQNPCSSGQFSPYPGSISCCDCPSPLVPTNDRSGCQSSSRRRRLLSMDQFVLDKFNQDIQSNFYKNKIHAANKNKENNSSITIASNLSKTKVDIYDQKSLDEQ